MLRRKFLRDTLYTSSLAPIIGVGSNAWRGEEVHKLTILHTNDIHSRLEPFPMDGSRNEGRGGAARRAALINQVRANEEHVLLFDSGDIFQGTPYFNIFNGEIEMKVMSEIGYDAATIGNHDYDGGIDGLDQQMNHANFPFIISNYDMSDTVLNGKTRKYQIFEKGDVKIGVYGLGIELDGLVPESLYKNTKYLSPIENAQKYESLLKNDHKCDFVVCLSHLGFKYRDGKISDVKLAQQTSHTDLILGGHTHTFLREPVKEKNQKGVPVLINQVGFGGILIGRLDVYFHKKKKKKIINDNAIIVR